MAASFVLALVFVLDFVLVFANPFACDNPSKNQINVSTPTMPAGVLELLACITVIDAAVGY